ncbi:hypothetical protein NQ314_018419 [Rhamnusium bicolor]|uniref:Ionotropic glutamate receptor C-terminal domain-containing protein n=1 Tax=Rhamnusium bicolor TaxID=1586634 RepID=A0AAV8WR02_9CUCU|nr:hypothetical protein NQ314_018419 [Rhamnusium bicolor]
MIGDLMNGRADISGTTAFIQLERMEYLKYIIPTTYDTLRIVFRAPPLSYTANVFILPFNIIVWCSFFLILTISGIFFYIIVLYEWEYNIKVDKQRRNRLKPSLLEVILSQVSAVTQRGGYLEPNTFSGRAVLIVIFILCMFMYTAFSGYIVVLLQYTSDSIKDLESLYNSKIEIGVEDTVYNRYYFTTPSKETNETYRKLIYNNRVAPKGQEPNYFSAKDGMKKVRNEFFAFHVELGTAYHLIRETFKDDEKCKIKDVDTIIKSEEPYLSVPKNSVYVDIFLVGFRRFFETGLHKREYNKLFAPKPECHGRRGNYVSVGLIDCYFPFLIFGIGVLISWILFLIEVLVNTLTKKTETSSTLQYLN